MLVGDDGKQLRRVVALLQQAQDAGQRWFVAVPVVCELVWVLDAVYDVPRREIAATLDALLEEPLYEVDQRESVAEALGR